MNVANDMNLDLQRIDCECEYLHLHVDCDALINATNYPCLMGLKYVMGRLLVKRDVDDYVSILDLNATVYDPVPTNTSRKSFFYIDLVYGFFYGFIIHKVDRQQIIIKFCSLLPVK